MKQAFFNLFIAVFIAGAAISTTGCKEDTIIKSDLVPGGDKIDLIPVDTLTVNTSTVIIDTLNTSTSPSSQFIIHGLGTVDDPFFGKTNMGVYFQVVPTSNQFVFPGTIDSAFLILPYTGFKWGDTNASSVQKFTVYRTDDVLKKDETYYSNVRKSASEVVSLPYSTDLQKISEPVVVSGLSRKAHIRIPLDRNSKLLQDLPTGAAAATTTAEFVTFLRGLYVEPDMNQAGTLVPYYFLEGANDYERASIQFFYKTDSVRSFFFNFIASDCAHYNYIKRDEARLKEIANTANTSQEIAVLQNEPGAAIDIIVPHIKNLPAGIINRATLEITQVSTGNASADVNYTAPIRIIPYVVDANGAVSSVQEASGFVDGNRQTFSTGGIEYVKYQINISNTVQNAVIGKWDELHLRITGAKGFPGAYRLVAGGSKNPNLSYRTKLTVFYSKPQL